MAVRARAARRWCGSGPCGCGRPAVTAAARPRHRGDGDRVPGDTRTAAHHRQLRAPASTPPPAGRPDRPALSRRDSAGRPVAKRSGSKASDYSPVPPLAAEEATELFADRARAGRPDFDLDREPVGAVAEICRQLDGLPLAIELAAARMRVMSSLDVARRLDGLRLLSGGSRGAPLEAAEPHRDDRLVLPAAGRARAGRCSHGFQCSPVDLTSTRRTACAVRTVRTEDDTLDLLTGLVDKSMVTMRSEAGRTRYGVLETLRAYGRERLRDNGVDDRYARRHATYFAELAQRAAAGMHGPDEQAWVERMVPDYDNLRVAFEHAMTASDIDSALRLVTSLSEFVHLRIGFEASGWAERALEVVDPSIRCSPPRSASPRGAHGTAAIKRGRGTLASLAARPPSRSRQRPRGIPRRRARGRGASTRAIRRPRWRITKGR